MKAQRIITFLLVHFYFTAGTVCKNSSHDAAFKIWVTLTPLHDAQPPYKPADFNAACCGLNFCQCDVNWDVT